MSEAISAAAVAFAVKDLPDDELVRLNLIAQANGTRMHDATKDALAGVVLARLT